MGSRVMQWIVRLQGATHYGRVSQIIRFLSRLDVSNLDFILKGRAEHISFFFLSDVKFFYLD